MISDDGGVRTPSSLGRSSGQAAIEARLGADLAGLRMALCALPQQLAAHVQAIQHTTLPTAPQAWQPRLAPGSLLVQGQPLDVAGAPGLESTTGAGGASHDAQFMATAAAELEALNARVSHLEAAVAQQAADHRFSFQALAGELAWLKQQKANRRPGRRERQQATSEAGFRLSSPAYVPERDAGHPRGDEANSGVDGSGHGIQVGVHDGMSATVVATRLHAHPMESHHSSGLAEAQSLGTCVGKTPEAVSEEASNSVEHAAPHPLTDAQNQRAGLADAGTSERSIGEPSGDLHMLHSDGQVEPMQTPIADGDAGPAVLVSAASNDPPRLAEVALNSPIYVATRRSDIRDDQPDVVLMLVVSVASMPQASRYFSLGRGAWAIACGRRIHGRNALDHAVRAGAGTEVIRSLASGVVGNRMEVVDEALSIAVRAGRVSACMTLLELGADCVRKPRDGGPTLLMEAAAAGRAVMCSVLTDASEMQGVSVDGQDDDGWTALHHAACHGHLGVCAALLESLNFQAAGAVDDLQRNALHVAVSEGHVAVCSILLSHAKFDGANARLTDDSTVLHLTACNGHDEMCTLLLASSKFNVANGVDLDSESALHVAAQSGHAAVCSALLGSEKFSVVDAQAEGGSTALHLAAHNGHAEACSVLLASSRFHAKKSKDHDGQTALDIARKCGKSTLLDAFELS
mmetsp:Transcript_84287/g.219356  ORF Transcript_84287/g.219356 Transcript_84287/m.219356 type:complete len:689 (+) Transcript_84287:72-2138(+)